MLLESELQEGSEGNGGKLDKCWPPRQTGKEPGTETRGGEVVIFLFIQSGWHRVVRALKSGHLSPAVPCVSSFLTVHLMLYLF